MKFRMTLAALAMFPAGGAFAQDECTAYSAEDPYDLTEDQLAGFYDCLSDKMAEGYAAEGDEIGSVYREWTSAQTRLGIAPTHGNRAVRTYANDIAAEQYLQFAEDIEMPAGSILAKESISFSSKRAAARPGPLFLMTKLEEGGAPETNDWLYAGVQPNGKVMRVSQSFCHDCHIGFDYQDSLGYPVEETRVSQ